MFDHDERNENASELMQAWAEWEAEQELSEVVEEQIDGERIECDNDAESALELEREQFNNDEYAFDTDLLNEF